MQFRNAFAYKAAGLKILLTFLKIFYERCSPELACGVKKKFLETLIAFEVIIVQPAPHIIFPAIFSRVLLWCIRPSTFSIKNGWSHSLSKKKKKRVSIFFYCRTRHELGPSGGTKSTHKWYFPMVFSMTRCGCTTRIQRNTYDTLYIRAGP